MAGGCSSTGCGRAGWPRPPRTSTSGSRRSRRPTSCGVWYGHDPAKFGDFRRRYGDELRDPERAAALAHLRELAAAGPVTLLTATRDLEHSQAADLAERLQQS